MRIRKATKQRSTVLATAVVIALAVILTLFLKTLHFVAKDLGNVELLWRESEAFITIGERRSGIQGTLAQLVWRDLRAMISYPTDDSSDNLVLVHIRSEAVERHENRGISGTMLFPYKNTIYHTVGVVESNWPAVWRWTGSAFEKLDKTQGTRVVTSFKLLTEVIAREGWNTTNTHFSSDRRNVYQFQVSGNGYELILQDEDRARDRTRTVSLRRFGSNQTEQLLATGSTAFHLSTSKTYLDFLAKTNGVTAH